MNHLENKLSPVNSILVVDDEELVNCFVTRALQKIGYAVQSATSLATTRDYLRQNAQSLPRLILSDVRMSDGLGTDLWNEYGATYANFYAKPPVRFMTGTTNAISSAFLKDSGIDMNEYVLLKPFTLEGLHSFVEASLLQATADRVTFVASANKRTAAQQTNRPHLPIPYAISPISVF